MKLRRQASTLCALLAVCATIAHAGPNRFGHSDRVERHMLPSVTTGPMDPAWSADGKWLAFSMRGDIWKIPAEGGTATALTRGPAWHFEPAWSPDGTRVALSMDTDGNLDIGVVSANGGAVQRITEHRAVDVEPAWSRDGSSLYFVSARAGGFRIFQHDLTSGKDTAVATGFQPAISPDGKHLAYVASVQGRLGTGGLWVKELPNGEPRLVHYEESEYRMKPAWTPDGQNLLYVSDEMGSNDVAVVPVAGGNPIVLTADARDEYAAAPHPDGERFAFISNRSGPMTLHTVALGGGPAGSWRDVPIRARTAAHSHWSRARACAGTERTAYTRAHLREGKRHARLHARWRIPSRDCGHRDTLLPHTGRIRCGSTRRPYIDRGNEGPRVQAAGRGTGCAGRWREHSRHCASRA